VDVLFIPGDVAVRECSLADVHQRLELRKVARPVIAFDEEIAPGQSRDLGEL
jgi:hypothetical protein